MALEHELNLGVAEAELMKARAHGDLSENAEYEGPPRSARASFRRGWGKLKKRMGDLGMLNLNNIPHDRAVRYGSRVWLKDMAKASLERSNTSW